MNETPSQPIDTKIAENRAASAVYKILNLWNCSQREKMALLGITSKAALCKFRSHPEKLKLTPDQVTRLSLLLNIHYALRTVFSNPVNVYGYMKMTNNNAPFSGHSPVSIAMRDFVGLYSTFNFIDALKDSGW
jgi:hypothetical protein